jgi:hypothetical protein
MRGDARKKPRQASPTLPDSVTTLCVTFPSSLQNFPMPKHIKELPPQPFPSFFFHLSLLSSLSLPSLPSLSSSLLLSSSSLLPLLPSSSSLLPSSLSLLSSSSLPSLLLLCLHHCCCAFVVVAFASSLVFLPMIPSSTRNLTLSNIL